MDFLDKLVLPQSLEHIEVLHYMTIMVLFLFLPFISLLTAGTTLSLYYRRKGRNDNSGFFIRFAKDIIELCTVNKSVGIGFGILPLLALVMIFAQLLHTAAMPAVDYLGFSFIFILVGVVLVYIYRYSFGIKTIFESIAGLTETSKDRLNPEILNEVEEYKSSAGKLNKNTGLYGLILLFIATYLYIAGFTLAMHPEEWKKVSTIGYLFTSGAVFFRWVYFLLASFVLTGSLILFYFFYWEGGKKAPEDYLDFVKKRTTFIILPFALLLPFILLVNIISLPGSALSSSVFGFGAFALVMLFLLFHFLYTMIKNSSFRLGGMIFVVVLLSSLSLIIAEQTAFKNSTKKHSLLISEEYDKDKKELQASIVSTGGLSAEDIYNKKCAACHRFDQRVVGPPYNAVLPKYEGKIEQLAEFILNPVKIDKDYPIMPNQGLKPKEAKAIAKYLLDEYKK